MYGTSGSQATITREAIAVEPIPERYGQMLRNILLDRGFGDVPTSDGYVLSVSPLVTSEFDLGLAPDNTATRRQVTISTTMQIKKAGLILLDRKLTANNTYNVLVSQYGTVVSQQNTSKLVIDELARQIELQSALYMKDHGVGQ